MDSDDEAIEYTTANVPKEIRLLMREKLPINHPLIDGFVWSDWVVAMTPDKRNSDFKSRSTGDHERTGYRITKLALVNQFGNQKPCGVYEWMARHTVTGETFVVYIGSTCRSKQGSFIDRICEYCTNGGHKEDYIDTALVHEYELLVRYKGSGDFALHNHNKLRAENDENEILKHYDYAWNIRSAKQIERDLPEH